MSDPVPAITPSGPPAADQTRELLQFLREENTANRAAVRDEAEANRKLLLDTVKFVSFPVGIAILVAGWLGFRSINDLKATLETEARKSTQGEIARMQGEIRSRLTDQFQTPALQKMVKEAAAEQTRTAAEPLIKTEVATQVKSRVEAERPVIVATVTQQTKEAVRQMGPQIDLQVRDSVQASVQRQVEPVVQKMSDLKVDTDLQQLIIRMDSDDAHAFDQLVALANQTRDGARKSLIVSAINDVLIQHEDRISIGREFKTTMTHDMLIAALSSLSPLDRGAAVDKLAANAEPSLLPRIVEVATTDASLNVRCKAGRVFDALTKQPFMCLDKPSQLAWWDANRESFRNQAP